MRMIYQLWRSQRAASAVEFALVVPAVATLFVGGMNFGIYYLSRNAVNFAVDEGARYASIYPTPSVTEIENRVKDKTLRNFEEGTLEIKVEPGISGALNYIDVEANTSVKIDLAFTSLGDIPISSKKRVYVGNNS